MPRRPTLGARTLLLAAAFVTLGCGDGTGIDDLPRCSGPVTMSVSGDAVPVLSWRPACRADYIAVHGMVPGVGLAWEARSLDWRIAPGIRFGESSIGIRETVPARRLGRDTSYSIIVSHRVGERGDFSYEEEVFGFTTITACGEVVNGACRTTAERFANTTREGVVLAAEATGASVTRGDTVWTTFRVVNPAAYPVTVALSDNLQRRVHLELTPPGGVQSSGLNRTYFDDPWAVSLVVPASGQLQWRVPFTGTLALGISANECLTPGTWTLGFFVNAANGGRRVRAAPVTVTLVERTSSRVNCV